MHKCLFIAPVLLAAPVFAGTNIRGLTQARRSEHRVVIEVNVPGTSAYDTILNNVENLKKAFAPAKVQVEIVCHGRGLDMLFTTHNSVATRLTRVQKAGVDFMACSNTMHGRHVDRSSLFSFVQVVDSGVAEVVRKQEAGWSYLKGAF